MDNGKCLGKCLGIGEKAPSFKAETTYGPVAFPEDYKGSWVVFFSHPNAFTPVCTTEILTFASMAGQFASRGCKLLGLCVDSNPSNIQWCREMSRYQWKNISNQTINFPIVSDEMGSVATLYGMIMPAVSATKTVRDVYVIDPQGTIRAILSYPLTTGRNIAEILRLVLALQSFDATGNPTPAGWMPGEPSVYPPPQTLPQSMTRVESVQSEGAHCLDWYLCFTGPGNNGSAVAGMANMAAEAEMAGKTMAAAQTKPNAAMPNMSMPTQVSPAQTAVKPNAPMPSMSMPTQVSPAQTAAKPSAPMPSMSMPTQVSPAQTAVKPNAAMPSMSMPTQVSPAQTAAKPNAPMPNMTVPTQISPAQTAAKPNAPMPSMSMPTQVSPAQTAAKPNMTMPTETAQPNVAHDIPMFEANRSMVSGIGKQNSEGLTGGFPILGNMMKKENPNTEKPAQNTSAYSDELIDAKNDYFISRDFPYNS